MATAGVVLGFDYGTKFIGVAVGQHLTQTARALAHLPAKDGIPDWQAVERLLQEWQPGQLIVGLPLNMDGSESELSRRARKFGNRLHGRFGLPVHCQDERLSSFEAKSRLSAQSKLRHRGGAIDSLAAVVILEHWLAESAAD